MSIIEAKSPHVKLSRVTNRSERLKPWIRRTVAQRIAAVKKCPELSRIRRKVRLRTLKGTSRTEKSRIKRATSNRMKDCNPLMMSSYYSYMLRFSLVVGSSTMRQSGRMLLRRVTNCLCVSQTIQFFHSQQHLSHNSLLHHLEVLD